MATSPLALRKHLRHLKDPRIDRCKRHLFLDIITMALCAVIGGANTWPDIATFARRRKDWFQRFLAPGKGIRLIPGNWTDGNGVAFAEVTKLAVVSVAFLLNG